MTRRPAAIRAVFCLSFGAFLAAMLAVLAAVWLSGCDGGTSSEAGNPGLFEMRDGGGKPVPFDGFAQFFAQGADPEFFTLPPDDGTTPPRVTLGGNGKPTALLLQGGPYFSIEYADLLQAMLRKPQLPLGKVAALNPSLPPFNVVLISDSSAGWLGGVYLDSVTGKLRTANQNGDTLIVTVVRERSYSGTVDTTTTVGAPMALFVPGTPYFAQVHRGAFRFDGMPRARLPLRWVCRDGRIYSMPDSIGRNSDTAGDTVTAMLRPGERIDSVALPPMVPTLDPPAATPAGSYDFTDSVDVALSASAPGARIYYTLDGGTPDLNATLYAGPIRLRASATLKAVAYLKGYNRSAVSANNYRLVPAAPAAKPLGQGFRDSLKVTLSAADDQTIRYTLDGSDPKAASAATYSAPLVLKQTATLKAVATQPGLGYSAEVDEQYILLTDTTVTGVP